MRQAILSEIQKIRRKYKESAEEIFSGYNRENSLSKDYEGRQIFELLQNADDEAEKGKGKVLISFDGKTLSISNTGKPFTFQGVKSLLYPNASPKQIQANKIGCKGLGFRSILTWAESIIVASQDFSIEFSKKYAEEFLQEIFEENPSLVDDLSALTREKYPIATLTCPKILSENMLLSGYATTIIINCKDELKDIIETQIKNLQFEELIFLPNTIEVEVICDGYHKKFEKIIDSDSVLIQSEDLINNISDVAIWNVYKKVGTILNNDGEEKSYEFIIAYDPEHKHLGKVLYSYFKTDIKLELPVLVHGTFELTSDRNNLQKESNVNLQLIELLAEFLVETAVDITKKQEECSYYPLKMAISHEMDNILRDSYHLEEKLRLNLKSKAIFPTILNKYISLDDCPVFSDYNFQNYLYKNDFSKLLQQTNDKSIVDYLKKELHLGFYTYNTFCNKINDNIDHYTLDAKVNLINLVKKQYGDIHNPGIFPHLLVDNNNNNIIDNAKVYPLPEKENIIDLPDWVDIRFLNAEMQNKLYSLMGIRTVRGLTSSLSEYNLEEYSADKLIKNVTSQATEEVDSIEKCKDILRWLFGCFKQNLGQSISDLKVKVICTDGEIRYANQCYLGSEFGNEFGERLVSIYSDKFVSKDRMDINFPDIAVAKKFFTWIGASLFPRLQYKNLIGKEKAEYMGEDYSFFCDDGNFYTQDQFQLYEMQTVKVMTFENFETILQNVGFNDILIWALLDDNFSKRLSCSTEEHNNLSIISGIPYKKQNTRSVKNYNMKSYIKFVVKNTEWISDKFDNKCMPQYCCMEQMDLEPFIIRPSVDYDYIQNTVKAPCRRDIDSILEKVGIADQFQELDKKTIYEVLYKLPEIDTNFKRGKKVYSRIIKGIKNTDSLISNNTEYDRFIKDGSVLSSNANGLEYTPVNKTYYIDKKEYSEEILKKFNIIRVDPRSGNELVKKIFGVSPLKNLDASIIGEPTIHRFNEVFIKDYVSFLPFVLACRMSALKKKGVDDEYRKLSGTKVILCSKIQISYVLDGKTEICSIGDYEMVYLRKLNVAYICVPENQNTFCELRQKFKFGEAVTDVISAVLDVNEDKGFYQTLYSSNTADRIEWLISEKGTDSVENLKFAKSRFINKISTKEEFWRTLAQISNIDLTEELNMTELISKLGFSDYSVENIDYDDLNNEKNGDHFVEIFKKLTIDINDYNIFSIHPIDLRGYWSSILKKKMQIYEDKYLVSAYEHLKNNEKCIEEYETLRQKYDYSEDYIKIENTVNNNIDVIFKDNYGVNFSDLDNISGTISKIVSDKKCAISKDLFDKLHSEYDENILELYVLFDKTEELVLPENKSMIKKDNADIDSEMKVNDIVQEVLSGDSLGFIDVTIKSETGKDLTTKENKISGHTKQSHSEETEKHKQTIGLIGEATVYRELTQIYDKVDWVSGNAEKAGKVLKGDDTLGYDIRYKDEFGETQYIEVKASKNTNIVFYLSAKELKFACDNAENYEVIYVVIGDDYQPIGKPWRLGHIFKLEEDEELLYNHKFKIENDKYKISANRTV